MSTYFTGYIKQPEQCLAIRKRVTKMLVITICIIAVTIGSIQ